jgi:hypothetical protein
MAFIVMMVSVLGYGLVAMAVFAMLGMFIND